MAVLTIDNEIFDRDNAVIPWANSAGNLGDQDGTPWYIPTLYAKKVLFDFYKSTVWKEVTNTDYEGQFRNMGDTIKIRQAPAMTVNDYDKGTDLTYSVPAKDATEMTIAYGKYVAFAIEDVDKVQMDVDLMNMYASDASERLSIQVDVDVLTAMATGVDSDNTGNTAGAISGSIALGAVTDATTNIEIDRTNSLDKIVELNQALDEQNVPQDGRFVIIPAWYASRLKLSDLKAADFSGDSTGAETSYYVLCGTKVATSFAMQLSKVETLRIQQTFGEYWRTLWVYGIKVVRPEALATLICHPA